jgi:hypothetical protein
MLPKKSFKKTKSACEVAIAFFGFAMKRRGKIFFREITFCAFQKRPGCVVHETVAVA